MDRLRVSGRQILLLGLVVAFGGLVLSYPPLVLTGIVLTLAALSAPLWNRVVPRLVVIRSVEPNRIERGGTARVELTLTNAVQRRIRSFVALEQQGDRRVSVDVPELRRGGTWRWGYDIVGVRRGRLDVGPLEFRQPDPFGLSRLSVSLGQQDYLWVYPRLHQIEVLPSSRIRDLDGPTSDTSPNGTSAFHQLREYVPGDDLRHIHWRSTARTGTMMVRHLVDTSRPEALIVVDNRALASSAEDFEEVVEAAASIIAETQRRDYPISLALAHEEEMTETDLGLTMLDRLAVAAQVEEEDLLRLADRVRSIPGQVMLFFTGDLDAVDLQAVSKIARGFDSGLLISIVGDRRSPFVLPPGMNGISAPDASSFARQWNGEVR